MKTMKRGKKSKKSKMRLKSSTRQAIRDVAKAAAVGAVLAAAEEIALKVDHDRNGAAKRSAGKKSSRPAKSRS